MWESQQLFILSLIIEHEGACPSELSQPTGQVLPRAPREEGVLADVPTRLRAKAC